MRMIKRPVPVGSRWPLATTRFLLMAKRIKCCCGVMQLTSFCVTAAGVTYYNTSIRGPGKLLILLPNSFLDGRFCIIVPGFGAAVVADAHWNGSATGDVALIDPLSKRDCLIALDDAADLAELTTL
jgi:hypothetical protein